MNEDADLLRRYAETRDEACFRAVVERHLGFVHAVNLRRLRDPHLAADATQAVFIALARKAAQVARGPSVAGWLHRSSCFESRNLMRAQVHRRDREQQAVLIGTAAPSVAPAPTEAPAGALEAVIDDALAELPARDREAILARFFQNRSFGEIGVEIGRSENAARMRVERALTRLRAGLARRGIESSAAVLAGALPGYAATTAPAGLAASVIQAAVVAGASASGLAAAFFLMTTTQKIISAVLVLSACGLLVHQSAQTRRLEKELGALRAEQTETARRSDDLLRELTAVRAEAA